MIAKMTAVEWLCSQIYTIQVELKAGNNHLKMKIEQAKQMEIDQAEKLKDFDTWKEWKNEKQKK